MRGHRQEDTGKNRPPIGGEKSICFGMSTLNCASAFNAIKGENLKVYCPKAFFFPLMSFGANTVEPRYNTEL